MASDEPRDAHVGRKAVDLGLITADQLAKVLRTRPPSLSAALVSGGLLTERQVEVLGQGSAPTKVGKYRIVRELGRGGMGVVYEAEDQELHRRVALKMLLSSVQADGQESAPEEERFIRESRLSANLPKHPHVVGVYEAGIVDGRRFIAMEFIEGRQYSEWRQGKSVTAKQRIAVLRDVALAVDHAHRHGVIHRDLKPQNILVDAKQEPHVTDFGLAKRAAGRQATQALTLSGQIMGTPAYMSPEQAEGRKDVDRRSDVWALGVMLYEVITGRLPFSGQTPLEILMKAVKEPVLPPSAFVKVDRTLENICLKALAKDPRERYAGARAFAEDLSHWLKGHKIAVAAPRRKLSRVWIAVAAVAALAVVVVLALPAPEDDHDHAGRAKDFVAQGRALLDKGRYADAIVAFHRASEEDPGNRAAAAGKKEAETKIAEAGRRVDVPPPPTEPESDVLKSVDVTRPVAGVWVKGPDGLRGTGPCARIELPIEIPDEYDFRIDFTRHSGTDVAQLLTDGGRRFMWHMGGWGNTVLGFSHFEGKSATHHVPGGLTDGKRHVSLVEIRRDRLRAYLDGRMVVDVKSGPTDAAEMGDWKMPATRHLGLGANGDVTFHAVLLLPRAAAAVEKPALRAHPIGVHVLAPLPDGRSVLTAGFDNVVRLWDLETGKERRKLSEGVMPVSGAASPDGRWIGVGFLDHGFKVWDVARLEPRVFAGHRGQVTGVAFTPDGKWAATSSVDASVRLWDTASGASKIVTEGFSKGAMCVSLSLDGKTLAAGGAERQLRVFDVASGREIRRVDNLHEEVVSCVAVSPKGKTVLTGGNDRTAILTDVESGRRKTLATFSTPRKDIRQVAFSPDGRWALVASTEGTLAIFDAAEGTSIFTHKESEGFFSAAFSRNGDQLIAGTAGGSLRFWDLRPLRSSR